MKITNIINCNSLFMCKCSAASAHVYEKDIKFNVARKAAHLLRISIILFSEIYRFLLKVCFHNQLAETKYKTNFAFELNPLL